MQIIDAHLHLWDSRDSRYLNLNGGGRQRFWGSFGQIDQRYLVDDFCKDFASSGVVKAVHIDAGFDTSDPVTETSLLQNMADNPASNGFPHAIVGWADLSDTNVEAVLEAHCDHANFRGVRQMLNRHPVPLLNLADHDYLSNEIWLRNFALLHTYDLSFDLSINPFQMLQAARFAGTYLDVPMALCHLGFPIERYGAGIEIWRSGMQALAARPNVYVKMSGIGMFDRYWNADGVKRIILETLDMFGVKRMMFGSNFPIDKLMVPAADLMNALFDVTKTLSNTEREQLFFTTASEFYRI